MARPHPVSAGLVWLADYLTSRGRNPDMVNEWTANDLPVAFEDSNRRGQYWNPSPELMADFAVWLNKHQPKPEPDRWRRAREIVEQERDQARDERDQYRRSGDEWKECYADAVRERDQWMTRAEAAEARTAVTREDIEKVVWDWSNTDTPGPLATDLRLLTDSLDALVSGPDPAVFVVRESDVVAVEVERDSHDEWFADGEHVYAHSAEDARNLAGVYMQKVVRRHAVARAIEAGQAVDPLLDKAQEFAALADWELTDREARLLHTVARHVLGQEASDGR